MKRLFRWIRRENEEEIKANTKQYRVLDHQGHETSRWVFVRVGLSCARVGRGRHVIRLAVTRERNSERR